MLVVDDEVRLADGIRRGLLAEGMTVDVAHDGVPPGGCSRPRSRSSRCRRQAASTKRASTSANTFGCSECTQWPAPLIVTRRTFGKRASICGANSSRT